MDKLDEEWRLEQFAEKVFQVLHPDEPKLLEGEAYEEEEEDDGC